MTNKPNERRLKSPEEVPIPSETLLDVDKENVPDEVIKPVEEVPSLSPEDSSTPEKILIEESSDPSEETPKKAPTPVPESSTVDPEVLVVLEELLTAVDDENLAHENPLIKKPKRKYVRRTFNNEPKLKKPKLEELQEVPAESETPLPVMPFFINPNLNYHDLMMMLCVQMRVPYQYDINDRGRDLNGVIIVQEIFLVLRFQVMKNFIEKTKVIINEADEPGTVAENVVMPPLPGTPMDTEQLSLPVQPINLDAGSSESGKEEAPEVKPFSAPTSAFEACSQPKSGDTTTNKHFVVM
ncbi:hypothetical protein CAEBREN_06074 [Caenorhabditis brenneri]|uniref:Uncharacterized protein n=1 Tax=Caenorhabditis brenneri TaxID=135651 RepID=G0NL99_CAEBE|nr:hypothetical protein CAEBREN_06074 [Caenorhabditis brenneri]